MIEDAYSQRDREIAEIAARSAHPILAADFARRWPREPGDPADPTEAEIKADGTPVTETDRAAERAIRAVLNRECPKDAIYGEEYGRDDGPQSGRLWLVDPLDGTKSFVRGTPYFSTQIALWCGDRPVIGVSSAPIARELAVAMRGQGATLNGRALAVSKISRLDQAHISLGNLRTLAKGPGWSGLATIVAEVARIRGYGDFAHYHLLARGALEAVIESDVHILDVAALAVVVTEAGGVVTDFQGRPLTLESTTVVASNGLLHEKLLAGLNR